MAQWLARVNGAVGAAVWGPVGLALLLGTSVCATACCGAFQFRHFGLWLRRTIGAALRGRAGSGSAAGSDSAAMSQLQSVCTALAGTLGTGNIVGVAGAITCGGPGAVFWMWAIALLGMGTSFAENVLGVRYRRKAASGEWRGGPMYYLADGVGGALGRTLAWVFALFCVLASFGMGNMSQTNSIAGSLDAAFGVPAAATGLALAGVTVLILRGGALGVGRVSEVLVPLMALFYIVGSLFCIALHADAIPAAFCAVFKGAFSLRAAGGGLLGSEMARAMRWGARRGAFSNEAGLGSAVMANAAADVGEPVQQGMWGIFEVFADTIIMCTLTALVVLTSGLVDAQTGLATGGISDAALVGQAFGTAFGALGARFIAVCVLLFAYSTVLAWSCYGAQAFEYLFGENAVWVYNAAFVAAAAVGAGMDLSLVWELSDTFNGLMMLPNLFGVLALSGVVASETKKYEEKIAGEKAERKRRAAMK